MTAVLLLVSYICSKPCLFVPIMKTFLLPLPISKSRNITRNHAELNFIYERVRVLNVPTASVRTGNILIWRPCHWETETSAGFHFLLLSSFFLFSFSFQIKSIWSDFRSNNERSNFLFFSLLLFQFQFQWWSIGSLYFHSFMTVSTLPQNWAQLNYVCLCQWQCWNATVSVYTAL